jgi:hypothetical protein
VVVRRSRAVPRPALAQRAHHHDQLRAEYGDVRHGGDEAWPERVFELGIERIAQIVLFAHRALRIDHSV